jgi:hypothetical protein
LQALAAAHADDEFQSDAAKPHVREAIEALRKDPSKYDQYAGRTSYMQVGLMHTQVDPWGLSSPRGQ